MRHGRSVATIDNENVTAQAIARLMVGRSVLLRVARGEAKPTNETLLNVVGLTARGERGETAVDDLTLSVRSGEIVGLAGVQGNGQDELVECIAGLRRPVSGVVEICGAAPAASPRATREAGLAYIPADRGGLGLSRESGIWENMAIGHLHDFRPGPSF